MFTQRFSQSHRPSNPGVPTDVEAVIHQSHCTGAQRDARFRPSEAKLTTPDRSGLALKGFGDNGLIEIRTAASLPTCHQFDIEWSDQTDLHQEAHLQTGQTGCHPKAVFVMSLAGTGRPATLLG